MNKRNKKILIVGAGFSILLAISCTFFQYRKAIMIQAQECIDSRTPKISDTVTEAYSDIFKTQSYEAIISTIYNPLDTSSQEMSIQALEENEEYLLLGYRKLNKSYVIKTPQNSIAAAWSTNDLGTLYCNDWGFSVHCYTGSTEQMTPLVDAKNSAAVLNSVYGTTPFGIPGGITAVGDHNTQTGYMWGRAKIGDRLYADTSYGQFIYEVTRTGYAVVSGSTFLMDEGDFAYGPNSSFQGLVLFTCYPFDALETDRRFIVFAKLIDGTVLS